jgi:tripartite ATP-independent transporter DctP family solute receptor
MMMKTSRNKTLLFVSILALVVFGYTGIAGALVDKVHIRAGVNVPPTDLMAGTLSHFLEVLKTKGAGNITYEFHPGGVLGSAREVHEAMKGNAVQMFSGTVGDLAGYDKVCDISNFPYLFNSADQGNRIWEKIGPEFYDGVAKRAGWRILYTWVGAPRDLTAKKMITKPEEVAGLKIRVPNWPIFITYFRKYLKASPNVITFGELFTALKTGIVDAQENPVYRSMASGFYDVTPYNMRTQHCFDLNDVHVTEEFWKNLSPGLQKIFTEAASETRAWTLNESRKLLDQSYGEAVAKYKAIMVQPDFAAFQKTAVGLEEDFPYLSDLVKKVRALQ